MVITRLVAAVGCVALVGCGPALPDVWTVEGAAPARVDEALSLARLRAPCDVGPWGGSLRFVAEPFDCGDVPGALGCAWQDSEGVPHVVVVAGPDQDAVETALMHELGHAAWTRCGEENRSHPWPFLAWVSWRQMELVGAQSVSPYEPGRLET